MLNKLAKKATEINKLNGLDDLSTVDWASEYKIPAFLNGVHSEISEAYEAFRYNNFQNFKEELADIIIRCLYISDKLEIDIDSEIENKLEKNKTRGYKHGNKRI